MADNAWQKSADPEKRRKAYLQYEKRKALREIKTKNVVKQTVLDRLRHKPGKFQ